jgi:rhodanese-related sulfurtransferase
MKKQLVLFALLVSYAFGYKDIDADEMAMFASSDAIIVDVRTPAEWKETGVITNVHLITYFDEKANPLKNDFMSKLNALTAKDKTKQIVLVCRTGVRSKFVAAVLDREGYKSVFNYKDGMMNWLGEKREVVKAK